MKLIAQSCTGVAVLLNGRLNGFLCERRHARENYKWSPVSISESIMGVARVSSRLGSTGGAKHLTIQSNICFPGGYRWENWLWQDFSVASSLPNVSIPWPNNSRWRGYFDTTGTASAVKVGYHPSGKLKAAPAGVIVAEAAAAAVVIAVVGLLLPSVLFFVSLLLVLVSP